MPWKINNFQFGCEKFSQFQIQMNYKTEIRFACICKILYLLDIIRIYLLIYVSSKIFLSHLLSFTKPIIDLIRKSSNYSLFSYINGNCLKRNSCKKK